MSVGNTLWDKIARKIYPRYLHQGETGWINGKIYVGVIHRSPDIANPAWKVVHYLHLENGSQIKFIGLVKKLHLDGDVSKDDSIFEIVKPVIQLDPVSPTTITIGDTICVSPSDRQYIYPLIQPLHPSSVTKM